MSERMLNESSDYATSMAMASTWIPSIRSVCHCYYDDTYLIQGEGYRIALLNLKSLREFLGEVR